MHKTHRLVWDWPIRITHWVMAVGITLNLFVLEEGDPPHRYIGYVVVGAVVLRLLWGLVTSGPSRLSNFPVGPRSVFRYLRAGLTSDQVGLQHNPLASWDYIFIWLCIFAMGITGFMMGTDKYWGEEWLEELHGNISVVLQVFVGIHLLGVLIDSIRKRRATWMLMLTGLKQK